MKARIRPGAIVAQDHGPVQTKAGELIDKVFDVHPFSEAWVKLTAWGYGERGTGNYGNGALYVAKEDVIPVDEPLKVDPYEDKEGVKIAEAPEELAEEIYRAYAYFTSRLLKLGTAHEGGQTVATSEERTQMFQAWLALKLAAFQSRPFAPPFPYNPIPAPSFGQ